VFNVEVVPVSSEKLLDSNGAGDSFVGGFLAKMCLLE
jgi:sugar/nucleoside kinase (ribokinase family)